MPDETVQPMTPTSGECKDVFICLHQTALTVELLFYSSLFFFSFPSLTLTDPSLSQVQSPALARDPQAMIRSPSSPASGAATTRALQLHKSHLLPSQPTLPPTLQVIAGAPGR